MYFDIMGEACEYKMNIPFWGNGLAVRQQAITWANIDLDLCRHMASLSLSELTPWVRMTRQWTG